jgi:hypothetical protein
MRRSLGGGTRIGALTILLVGGCSSGATGAVVFGAVMP